MNNDASMFSPADLPNYATDSLHQLLPTAEAQELLRRAQNYEDRALTRIYQLFSDRVFRFIYYRVQDRARAEELTNEVFVRMLESVERFQGTGADAALALTGWIFTIARNLVIDDIRRQRVRATEPLPEGDNELRDDAIDMELHLTRADLQAALGQLTEEQQTVLLLRFEEGFTSAQVAAMMGKTEMSIKALQRRGLATMARVLKPEEIQFSTGNAE
jgi:RNA polymerase sigma-70 factor (ECF subfamily)